MSPTPLSQLAEVIMGTAPSSDTYNSDGRGLPLIAGAGDYGERYPQPKKWTTSPTAVAKPGDIIICVRATIGDLNWADREYCLGRGVAALRTNNHLTTVEYLSHAMEHVKPELVARGTGSTFLAVRRGDIETLLIPVPFSDNPAKSLVEQQRIAAILDKADGICRKRQEVGRSADALAPSLFREMFDKWLRMPASEMPKLGDPTMASIASGVTKGRKFNGQPTVIVPYIRVANVQDGFLDLSEIKTIEALPSDVESLRLQHGDVLMTEGGDFDKLGRGAMWEADIPDCIHQNHVFRVRCNRQNLLPLYLASYIRTSIARAYFLRCAKKTSNLASINMTQLKATPVACPPIALQQEFCAEVEKIRQMQDQQEAFTREAGSLFNSLVQRAFKGEL